MYREDMRRAQLYIWHEWPDAFKLPPTSFIIFQGTQNLSYSSSESPHILAHCTDSKLFKIFDRDYNTTWP